MENLRLGDWERGRVRGERKRKGKEDCKGEMMNGKSKGEQEVGK